MILGDPIIFGGSGGPSSSDAILTVTVPTGSTVTMTKGGVTLTPTMWVQAADNTLDCALFVIGPSLFDSQNAWTITATLGLHTASDEVTIDSNEKYEISLGYVLVLYSYGSSSVSWQPTNKRYNSTSAGGKKPSVSYNSDNLFVSISGGGGTLELVDDIDMTPYKQLEITAGATAGGTVMPMFGIYQNPEYWYSGAQAVSQIARNGTSTLDISSLDTLSKVFIGLTNGSGTASVYVYDIRLK